MPPYDTLVQTVGAKIVANLLARHKCALLLMEFMDSVTLDQTVRFMPQKTMGTPLEKHSQQLLGPTTFPLATHMAQRAVRHPSLWLCRRHWQPPAQLRKTDAPASQHLARPVSKQERKIWRNKRGRVADPPRVHERTKEWTGRILTIPDMRRARTCHTDKICRLLLPRQ